MPRDNETADRIRSERRKQRTALIRRLEEEGADDLVERLQKCGKTIELNCTCCGEIRVCESRCDLKWCPACQHKLAARTAIRYAGITSAAQWPLFVTLTVKNHDESSFDFVREIRRAFGRLRRLRWFKKSVLGGIASIEVTNIGNGWHPHIHALLDCKWFAVTQTQPGPGSSKEKWNRACKVAAKEVAEQWEICCRRKASMKVRRVWKMDQANDKPIAHEVLKYSVKGSDLIECEDKIAPVIRMLDSCRLVTSWGTMYGHPSLKRPTTKGAACERCGAVGEWMPEQVLRYVTGKHRNYTDN